MWVPMAKYAHMDIYGYIRQYVDKYCYTIYIYIYMASGGCLFYLSLPGVTVALYLPMLELSALTPPIVDYFSGTGLMKTFLWTVGSFYVFGEQLDSTCCLQLRFHCLRKHIFPQFLSICKDPSYRNLEMLLFF